jgi:hypothetical protein
MRIRCVDTLDFPQCGISVAVHRARNVDNQDSQEVRVLKEKFRIATALCAAAVFAIALTSRAEDPATAPTTIPAIIQASDKTTIEAVIAAAKDEDVVVEGLCSEAEWSNSGKVMNLKFDGAEESRFSAVVFLKNREKIDEAFGGDATKAWSGAKLRIKGKLREYAGKSSAMKGRPEITIAEASQVTVVDLPTTQPAN